MYPYSSMGTPGMPSTLQPMAVSYSTMSPGNMYTGGALPMMMPNPAPMTMAGYPSGPPAQFTTGTNYSAMVAAPWGNPWPPTQPSSAAPPPAPGAPSWDQSRPQGGMAQGAPQSNQPAPRHQQQQPPAPAPYPPAQFAQPPAPPYAPSSHANGPPIQSQAQPQPQSQGQQGMILPTLNGRKVALLTGVDPENSDAASRGCSQMEAFLRRNDYTTSSVLFLNNDWTGYRNRLDRGVRELIQNARPGDSLFFYCIGYDCTLALRDLVDKLPRGARLICVFDCCYVTEKPAFRIHHTNPDPSRMAKAMAPITDYPAADVFLFEGMAEIRCVAWFKSAKGNTPLYTAGFIRALSRGPEGYWGKPSRTSFIQLSQDIDAEMDSIVHRLPKDALPKMTSLISCTRAYNVDQLFVL